MSDPSQPLAYTFEVVPRPEMPAVTLLRKRPYWLHLLLLLLTMLTTLIVGAQLYDNFLHGLPAFTLGSEFIPLFSPKWIWAHPARLLMGIPFSAALMTILLAHEMGHFLWCEKYGINATLPFFIPAPTLIGTMGAFIRIKSPIRTRRALFDIGVAGPIAGFVVAIPVLLLGLALSRPLAPMMGRENIDIGFPLIFRLGHWLLPAGHGQAVPLWHLALHPIAVAAWAGMFATSLNLLPGGQLDGGHILYAVAPRAHRWVTSVTVGVLAMLSVFWIGWLVWAVLLGVTGWRHPPVAPWPELDRGRWVLTLVVLALLVLTFLPAPIVGQGWLSPK
jgi:membrane-associated protease RseP (regulator of RpoE activity)